MIVGCRGMPVCLRNCVWSQKKRESCDQFCEICVWSHVNKKKLWLVEQKSVCVFWREAGVLLPLSPAYYCVTLSKLFGL